MRITRRATIPADVDDVFAVMTTEAFQREKLGGRSVRDASVDVVERGGGSVAIHSERTLSTRGMPGPVVAAVGERLTISEHQTWTPAVTGGTRRADLEIAVMGMPVRMRGTVVLAPDDVGTAIRVEGDLSCDLPLVGRKVEAAARPAIESTFDDEAALLAEHFG